MRFRNCVNVTLFCFHIYLSAIAASHINIFQVDERAICNIKKSCLDCLSLPHCSWCPTEKKCFSEHLQKYENFCDEEKIRNPSYEMSLEDNAKCACAGGEVENNCRPPGSSEPDCSGRGTCICGRCFCETNPDPAHPSKAIMGEHCEYDNFSCDDPKCNEGPYSIYEMMNEKIAENDKK